MISYDCFGRPYIDPFHKFTVEDWDMPFGSMGALWVYGDPKIPLSMLVKNQINTSVFEEATIINDENT